LNEHPFLSLVAAELAQAEAEHKPIHSLHEGYAVLLEELDEVWTECKKQTRDRDEAQVLVTRAAEGSDEGQQG